MNSSLAKACQLAPAALSGEAGWRARELLSHSEDFASRAPGLTCGALLNKNSVASEKEKLVGLEQDTAKFAGSVAREIKTGTAPWQGGKTGLLVARMDERHQEVKILPADTRKRKIQKCSAHGSANTLSWTVLWSRWHGFGYSGEVAGIQPAKSRGQTGPDEHCKGFGGDLGRPKVKIY